MKVKLNHVGLVVPSIQNFADLLSALELVGGTSPELDPIQRVRASFIDAGEDQEVYIELLEPAGEQSPIDKFLQKRGGGLHHLCFEVEDIYTTASKLTQKGFRQISPPVECVGYDKSFGLECGRPSKIAFFLLPKGTLLIELLQKGTKNK